ncbi:MAG TPA: TetR/AcrR family transcriptional regulator [Allosphingosinicella sp.]
MQKALDPLPVGRRRKPAGERKPREERWSELLDVAARIFARSGYDATSLQDIADELGMLKGSLYYYITTKGDLLAHLLRNAHEQGIRNIQPIAEGAGNPIERLAQMIRTHANYVCTDRDRTAVFLHERKRLTPEQRKDFLGDEHAYRRFFEAVITDGQREGLVRSELDPKLVALCLLGSLNSVYQWYKQSGEFSADAIGDTFVMSWLAGITTPAGAAVVGIMSTAAARKPRKPPGS